MNAYLIAAKANAFELDQHVGRAIDANQPDYIVEAIGCGEGHGETVSAHGKRFRDSVKHLFGMNQHLGLISNAAAKRLDALRGNLAVGRQRKGAPHPLTMR